MTERLINIPRDVMCVYVCLSAYKTLERVGDCLQISRVARMRPGNGFRHTQIWGSCVGRQKIYIFSLHRQARRGRLGILGLKYWEALAYSLVQH